MGCALTAGLIVILIMLLGGIALIAMDIGLDTGFLRDPFTERTDPLIKDVIAEVYDDYNPPTEASGKIKPNAADVRTKEGTPNQSTTTSGDSSCE